MYLIGHGFDSHRFDIVQPKSLIIGGIKIDYKHGLIGHSDGDLLIHAIIDSLMGALQQPDIGELFPNSDNKYANIASVYLLEETLQYIESLEIKQNRVYTINNIDCTIVAQAPKLSEYKQAIINNLQSTFKAMNYPTQINIKAKTAEHMGSLGREEGMACHVNALLSYNSR